MSSSLWSAPAVLALCWLVAVACAHRTPLPVPGDTDIAIARVTVQSATARPFTVDSADLHKELVEKLGTRARTAIQPARKFNYFRINEDKRRIVAFFEVRGYFDVQVEEPELQYDEQGQQVAITWRVSEGKRYRLTGVHLEGVPAAHVDDLHAMIPFSVGQAIQLDFFRPVRRALAERLQDQGYGHARVYSRLYVSREQGTCEWYFIADPGPKTRIGTIAIEGESRVPSAWIRRRLGLRPGDRFGPTAKRLAERDLLDTGAFSSVNILEDADIDKGLPEFPTTGGAVPPERIAADGSLIPRTLPETVGLRVRVVEAPRRQTRLEAGVEVDPWRLDSYVGTQIWLRHLFGSMHHLVIEGSVGHGLGFRDDTLDGLYGRALVRYVRPGFLSRLLDLRVSARYRDTLLPTARLRQIHLGPGVRASIGDGRFLDIDFWYRASQAIDFGPFDDDQRTTFGLAEDPRFSGAELALSLIEDRRDNLLETRAGHLWSVRAQAAPGGPLGERRYFSLAPDVRVYRPLGPAWALAVRASGAWVLGHDQSVPLAVRRFAGGPYGMRGFGRQRLSPTACIADPDPANGCANELVGGLSAMEASLEARYLPFRQIFGVAGFVDVGGASARANPLADGVGLALGLGVRARSWYIPISIDVAYRLLDRGALVSPTSTRPYQVFLRMGEAF